MRIFTRRRAIATALLVLLGAHFAVSVCARAAESGIYPDPGVAGADLAAALRTAAGTHRRVLVDFGGNWCPDCVVLDRYLQDDVNKPLLEAGYVVVHVNIGRLDRNLDIAARCGVPLGRGVPALAVLDSDGRVLYSQKGGEFEAMRRMRSDSVTECLRQWQPAATG
jgi:thiol:disulfide interchange protein